MSSLGNPVIRSLVVFVIVLILIGNFFITGFNNTEEQIMDIQENIVDIIEPEIISSSDPVNLPEKSEPSNNDASVLPRDKT